MTILQHGIAQAAAGGGGYQIARSLRFNSADTAYLNRTPASAGDRQKFTYSTWVKITSLASAIQRILGVGVTNYFGIDFGYSAGEFNINVDVGPDATRSQNYTTATFRDPSAWYHIVIAVDTTQATAANRLKIYVNNVLYSYTSTATIPQNVSTDVNNTAAHNIGRRVDGADRYTNTYMADIRLIDGQALDPTSFGEFDANTGVWSPITYSGTYGTNGFWLKLDDNSNNTAATLGKDSSGNSNNWTPNNFSVTAGVGNDSLVDSPTNYGTDTGAGGEVRGNYCTFNPLNVQIGSGSLANGNLQFTGNSGGSSYNFATSTIGIPSDTSTGYYFEYTQSTYGQYCGVCLYDVSAVASSLSSSNVPGDTTGNTNAGLTYRNDGQIYNFGSASTVTTWTAANDVIGIAIKSNKVWFSKNGVWISGDPAAGTSPSITLGTTRTLCPGAVGINAGILYANFGQRPFAYTAPSGFKALCSTNLPTPAIGATSTTLASKNFAPVLYTGNSSTQTITTDFQPDFVWVKSRSTADVHTLQDVIRGARYYLISNSNATEATQADSDGISAFTSTGFTLGYTDSDAWNKSPNNYVSWNWKAGGTAVTNTSGSISSQVSANPTAGFSVVTYTGNGTSGATFGHGLGAVPKMIIFKCRDTAYQWLTYQVALGNTAFVILDSDSAQTTGRGDFLNSTTPSSSLVTLGNTAGVNESTKTYVAYCFAEVAGFSKIGSYVGNGSADGAFIYTGFRPRYIMIKGTNLNHWSVKDTARSTSNVALANLFPNLTNAETSEYDYDILSNGFKIRSTSGTVNTSGQSYIFAAFAEAPFNYSRAR